MPEELIEHLNKAAAILTELIEREILWSGDGDVREWAIAHERITGKKVLPDE